MIFLQQYQLCFDTVKTTLAKSNEKMARYTNKHHQDTHLNVGNLVCMFTANLPLGIQLSSKLTPHWVGSFPINCSISSIAFYIQLPAAYGCVHPLFHVSYLWPHLGPTPSLPLAPYHLIILFLVKMRQKTSQINAQTILKLSIL